MDHRISRGLKNGGEGMLGVSPAPQPAPLGLLHIIYSSGNSLCPPLSSSTIISCHNILFFLSASITVLPAFVGVFDLQSDCPIRL